MRREASGSSFPVAGSTRSPSRRQRSPALGPLALRARSEAASLRTAGGGLDSARLERAIGELALALKTVQRLAVEKGLCTESEFYEKLREIDLEDGQADGKAPVG